MKSARVFMLAASVLALIACAEDFSFRDMFFSGSDAKYLEQVKAHPLAFQVPVAADSEAWRRAESVLTKYGKKMGGDGKLRKPTSNVLEMAPAEGGARINGACDAGSGFIYRITREPREDVVDYEVSCCGWTPEYRYNDTPAGTFDRRPKRFAQVMAYFIASGRLRAGAFWSTW